MSVVFSVKVSGDQPCRALAADVAQRYFELAGANADEIAASATAVATAIDSVADGERHIDLVFKRNGAVVEIDVSCGGQVEHCRLPLSS
jgi:hypothetical protein